MANIAPYHIKLTLTQGETLRSHLDETINTDAPYALVEDEKGTIGVVISENFYNLCMHAREIAENAPVLATPLSDGGYMTFEEVFD